VLVNNAGVYSHAGVLDEPVDEFRRLLESNTLGPLGLCQRLVPGMRRRGYGRVVNVSSGYGQGDALDGGGPAAYMLSKLALGGVTRMVAAAAGPRVKVNAADPGWVRTRMGGAGAPRSIEEGADTLVWLATLDDDGPTGGLFHDRRRVPW
jgi:NAD(P)-dependent dehydrogenase (short-subunit alcohol dehydrogenase family)